MQSAYVKACVLDQDAPSFDVTRREVVANEKRHRGKCCAVDLQAEAVEPNL